MSVTEDLFLMVDLPPAEAARRIADALGMDVKIRAGGIYVGGCGFAGTDRHVGGRVYENLYSEDDPAHDERTVFDGHSLVWDISRSGADHDLQRAAARAIFDAVVTRLRWPAVLTHDLQTAVAAWDPEHGLREFPPHTPVDDPAILVGGSAG